MKHLLLSIILVLLGLATYGQFPYFNSLASSSTDITTFGNSNATSAGYPKFVNSYLYLTPNTNGMSGFAVFNKDAFPSNGGIHIEFEFSANPNTGTDGADGFSFFLYDSKINISASNAGPSGGAFGYSTSGGIQGLQDAYLGVSFDEYGNFKAYEAGKNGFSKTSTFFGSNNANSFRNHVTIRGAAGKDFKTYNPSLSTSYNDYYWGYPVLYTSSTQNNNISKYAGYLKTDATSQTNASSTSTDMTPGGTNNLLYGYSSSPISTSSYTIGSATLATDSTNADFRKAYIDITPVLTSGTTTVSGYSITVKIKHGNTLETMVNSFYYPVGTIKYVDNRNDANSTGTGVVTNINTTPPASFNIGFAGSTGGSSNNHAIRNLFISIPKAAISNDDYASTCINTSTTTVGSTSIYPLSNDNAYDNESILNNSNIEPSSFRFNANAANLLDSSSSTTPHQTITYDANGIMSTITTTNTSGIWTYTTSTKQLIYTRAANYKGIATVQYSITSSYTGLNNNTYRSKASTVYVALTGPRVTKDSTTTYLITSINGGSSTTGSQNVISNDTSFTYVSGNSSLTTTGASSINTNSFYFSNGDGTVNLGATSMTNTYGNWGFANNRVSFTPSSSFSGIAKTFYRISTSDGCLSDVDTVIFNYPYSLPVEYSKELTGTFTSTNNILLSWTTGVEVNNSYFEIMRSYDANTWDSIGKISSKFSNGNGSNASYSFTDNNFSKGSIYYKLRQVDLDGKSTYSKVISLQANNEKQTLLFPNPATSSITIQNASIGATYKLISMAGKIVNSGIVNNQQQTIDISTLPSGIYWIQIIINSKSISNLKFIKK
ncbi:T9SS type A sorting domain-containing protein [Rhizosphaericola mali]|uniref:T9SS type A sorting domain-containing protein n=1 Tax=Rhizosphaericola mali TaxID=2545455 RepID=A0A5P2FWE0_9BACT|nr:T9SS type A sorting domain-containing protein [Rhizosphaericola mali]QES87495.1 T9SS type A sorting domain-containing protein [Rhizosphaericola mali]